MTNYIGIDIGASFIKGALLNVDRLSITNILKYPTPGPNHNNVTPLLTTRFEVRGELYCQKVNKMITELLKIDKNVAGIILSSQMHGTIIVDSKLVEITPFIGWQDERVLELSKIKDHTFLNLINTKTANLNMSHTGIKFKPGIMGSTLFWLQMNHVLKSPNDYVALFLGDYVAAKLTKGVRVVEPTQASGSGLFDVSTNQWDKEIIQSLGLDLANLPKIIHTGGIIGNYQYKQKSIPVHVSIGDLQATVLGSLAKPEETIINVGTGSQVSVVSNKIRPEKYDIRSYFDHTYLNTITHLPAGRALNVLIGLIYEIQKNIYELNTSVDVWSKLNKLIINKKNSEHLVSRISFYNNNATGHRAGIIDNITEDNFTIENIFFSAFENMATNYYQAYRKLKINKVTMKIVCSGGLIRKSHKLFELIQDKFKNKVSLAPYEEETLVGLLTLAIFCHNKLKTVKSATDILRRGKVTFS